MYAEIEPGLVVPHEYVWDYCSLPYPGHPKGCPNLGCFRSLEGFRKALRPRATRECPPTEFLEDMILDYSKPLYLVWNASEVGKRADSLMQRPETRLRTVAQFYNIRYWQQAARMGLYRVAEAFLDENPGTVVDLCPEAHGVRLIGPMWLGAGVKLRFNDWPAEEHSLGLVKYQVCITGFPLGYDRLVEKGIFGRDR
jgi:hypothetical protein